MVLKPNEILEENKRRTALFEAEYDPYYGIGSFIPRFEVSFGKFGTFLLPDIMEGLPYIQKIKKKKVKITEEVFAAFLMDRKKYDFEYWAYTHIRISPKENEDDNEFAPKNEKPDSDGLVRYKLNFPQRAILWPIIYAMIKAGLPIRVLIDKARQWGGSTMVQFVAQWIQREIKTAWNSCIVTDVEEQARNIRAMVTKASGHYPSQSGTFTLVNFEGSSKNKKIAETGNIISIGSMQRPESLRSGDIKIGHCSEVAYWEATEKRKPESLIKSIRGTIPASPWTMFVLESTANGTGNFFHREYLASVRGESDLKLCFVAWWQIEMYRRKVDGNVVNFIKSWNDYEKMLWKMGATIEGIAWHRFKLNKEFKGDTWSMFSEYPSTAEEAFQSTGRKYFPPAYIEGMRQFTRDPEFIGELTAKNDSGPECLEDIEFFNQPDGNLLVWCMPDKSIKVSNRYITVLDVGGRWKGADWSIIKTLDRLPLLYNDLPEVVSLWIGKMDYDLVAWKGAQIAQWYDAYFVPESNYYDRFKEYQEGDYMVTVLNIIANDYDNIYTRTDPKRVKEGMPSLYGFHTNIDTRPRVLATQLECFREQTYVETSARCLDEAESFVIKPNGRIEAADGSHDDEIIITAVMNHVSKYEMDPPRIIKERPRTGRNKIQNESSF